MTNKISQNRFKIAFAESINRYQGGASYHENTYALFTVNAGLQITGFEQVGSEI